MGLNRNAIAFLAMASQRDVDFERTLTIGRQWCLCTPRLLRAALREADIPVGLMQAMAVIEKGDRYCDPIFRCLGARLVDSMDASDYEGATVVHDLNRPVPAALRAQYSAVIDGGCLEHVFNFPIALAGCLESVAVGGHYLAVTPMNNWAGHGFYQFSPELYFRVLAEENGFAIRCILWRSETPWARWYQVTDPAAVARRVERSGLGPALLYVAAQRTELREVLSVPPQQSDYASLWAARLGTSRQANERPIHGTFARRVYQQLPGRFKRGWRWLRWGGLPPVVAEARGFVTNAHRIRTQNRDFTPVALRDAFSS
jgi:hypothetical protein